MKNGLEAETLQELKDIANKIRLHSIRSTNAANSGHPTSSCSAAEILSTLFFHTMRYNADFPKDPNSDRFVMSKGHACPALYGAWVEAGHLTIDQLMTLRKIDSDIEGHPTPRLDFIDVGTGSLGQGLSCAAGMAYTGKFFDRASYRVFCLLGDGETAEGSVWEALHFAAYYGLDNLVAVFDINRLGQSQATSMGHEMETYSSRLQAFGWEAVVVDGHDVTQLCSALKMAEQTKGRPFAILAKTFKGRGIDGVEDMDNWHGKPLGERAQAALEQIENRISNRGATTLTIQEPMKDAPVVPTDDSDIRLAAPPSYKLGEKVATRLAYGTGLVKLGQCCQRVIALDGDVKNSTYAEKFMKAFPERFIECFIAEQNMVGVAVGCATRNRTIPFCSTFATFFTRAYDQLRMGAISSANIKCCGSHAGCSIGEDGPSQMGLEDIGLFRSLPGSTVFYPSDAVTTERAVELAAKTVGICFIRTTRAATPVIYKNDKVFEVGKGKLVRRSPDDKVLIVGAGITLFEALKAADVLAQTAQLQCCVMDPFTLKPIDIDLLAAEAKRVGGRVLTVEDHYPEGGLGEAVCGALAHLPDVVVKRLAVSCLPRSGTPEQLMELCGISSNHIVEAVKEMLQ